MLIRRQVLRDCNFGAKSVQLHKCKSVTMTATVMMMIIMTLIIIIVGKRYIFCDVRYVCLLAIVRSGRFRKMHSSEDTRD